MSNRANRRLHRQEQWSSQKVVCQPVQEETPPRTATSRPHLMWLAAAVLAILATVLGLHHASRAAAVAPSAALVPVSKQAVVPAETLPTCVIAHEGDVNAKWLRATRMKTDSDRITLTLCDDATGERFTLSAPKGTPLPRKEDGQGGDLVLARLSTMPEHIDLDHFAFSSGPIEQVQKGQQVVSRDPQTGKTEIKTVTRTFEHKAYELVELELADAQTGAAADNLRGTPEHPFFTPGGMVPMGKLAVGQQVSTRDGKTLVVKSTRREAHPEGIPVYNFEVEGDHTYFVGQANGGTWVHNACSFNPNRIGHIFRDAAGHVNPTTAASQGRYAQLFEQVGSNAANLRNDAVASGLMPPQAAAVGNRAFTQTFNNGQVWVLTRPSGEIYDAGVNLAGSYR